MLQPHGGWQSIGFDDTYASMAIPRQSLKDSAAGCIAFAVQVPSHSFKFITERNKEKQEKFVKTERERKIETLSSVSQLEQIPEEIIESMLLNAQDNRNRWSRDLV